jgi:molybdenum cofactor cytidylyltransferase
MKAVAVILAAGQPRRMPHPKAIIEHEGGKSFLQSLVSTFGKAGCSVVGVVGHEAEAVRAQHPAVELVDADGWQKGVVASAQAGIRAALEAGADVVALHPVDMPSLRPATIKGLVSKVGDSAGLRPEFESAAGFPVVLARPTAERLLKADGGGTFEDVLKELQLTRVAVKDPGVVVNIAAPDVYERLFGGPPHPAPPPKKRARKSA